MIDIVKAFFETHILIKLATLFFVLGKMTSFLTIMMLFISKGTALILLIIYAVFILLSIVLCIAHFKLESKKKKNGKQ